MDIAQGLSVFPLVFLFALPVSQLIDDPRWYLISIIPQTCIVVGLVHCEESPKMRICCSQVENVNL